MTGLLGAIPDEFKYPAAIASLYPFARLVETQTSGTQGFILTGMILAVAAAVLIVQVNSGREK